MNERPQTLSDAKEFLDNYTPQYLDKEGNPIAQEDVEAYLCDPTYKIIKKDIFGDFLVSTVWLGIDHAYRFGNRRFIPPVLFETMIFNKQMFQSDEISADKMGGTVMYPDHELYNYQERYSTIEEAKIGHLEACKIAREAVNEVD